MPATTAETSAMGPPMIWRLPIFAETTGPFTALELPDPPLFHAALEAASGEFVALRGGSEEDVHAPIAAARIITPAGNKRDVATGEDARTPR